MRLRMLRPITGILLIIISVGALVWWESTGRETITMESVLITAENLQKGQVISEKDFIEVKSEDSTIVENSITLENFDKIKGSIVKQFIPKGAQVVKEMFLEKKQMLPGNKTIFSIDGEWIESRSSSLRKGDVVEIFNGQGDCFMGTYEVAYVKDENEQEVVGAEGELDQPILQRNFSSASVSNIEIIASLEEYKIIWDYVVNQGMKLLIVQKGDFKNE